MKTEEEIRKRLKMLQSAEELGELLLFRPSSKQYIRHAIQTLEWVLDEDL